MPESEPNTTSLPAGASPEDLEAALKKLQIVDVSEAIGAHAIDAADDYLSRETTGHGPVGFVKRVWKGNLARDIIRQRQINKARNQIVESGNIYAASGGNIAEHDSAVAAVVERFTSDYDLVHHQAGETNQSLEASQQGQALLAQIKQLIGEFAHNPTMGVDALEEAKNRILQEYGKRVHTKDRNHGLIYADNILQVAAQARFAAEHELTRDRIEAALSGHIGEAKIGVRTEARLEATDKALDWLHRHHITAVNEGTLGVGLAIGMAVAKWTTRSTVSAAARMAGFGIGGGIIAGTREHLRVGQERTLHMRQMAEGGQMPAEQAHRREQMEENRYETISANELAGQLEHVGDQLEAGDILGAIAVINAVEIRTGISDERRLDLINYSSKTSVEAERFNLDLRLAEAKVLLKRKLESLSDDELADSGLSSRDYPEALAQHARDFVEILESDISEKDKAFRKLRRQRTLKMAAIGAVLGMAIGDLSQEVRAGFDDGLRGVFDGPGGNRLSLLAGFFNHGHGADTSDFHKEFVNNAFNHHTGLSLPPDYHLVQEQPGGAWDLVDSKGDTIYHHFRWDSQGKPAIGILDYLHSKGWNFQEHKIGYQSHQMVERHVTRTPAEYLRAHPHDFIRAHRELWYDNNTPGIYDQNELRLDWGANGVGIDSHGNYVFNVSSMYPGGSFHEGLSTNAQQLIHEGKIAIALSMSRDTQHFVHLIPIDKHGNAVIKADSFLGRSLFENQNGHAHFDGGYAEAVQLTGKTPDGGESMRMLATVVGDNHAHSAPDISHHLAAVHKEHFITSLIPPEHAPVEVPPVIPIYSRAGLENLATANEGYGYYYGNYMSPETQARWAKERSPRLRDPNAQLNTGEELGWYRKKLKDERGADYIKELDDRIEGDEVLKNIDKDVRALVCIPVEAVSEADNIHNTLSLYARQSEQAKKKTLIVLNVNWKEEAESDPAKLVKIEKTLAEIERAKKDFPNLKVGYFKKKWTAEFVKSRRAKIYGEVVKTLYDTAAMVIERAIQEERWDPNDEAILITNDADAKGLRHNYLDLYIEALEKNPTVDVFSGIIRGGVESYKDAPGFGVVNGLYYVLNMLYYREQKAKRKIATPGANSAFRLSTLAAVGGGEDRNDLGSGADGAVGQKVKAARLEASEDRAVVRHVSFAQVDTDPDRLLGTYMNGLFVAHAWNDFDGNDGYVPRTEARGVVKKENVETDIDDIAKRIEINIEGFASDWYQDETVVASALALYFGIRDDRGRELYESEWTNDNFHFKFTKEGKEHLKKMLMRDSKGRFDPYGNRVRRRLYEVVQRTRGVGRKPGELTLEHPRFVQANV